jgi:hypothetical protein
MHCGAEVTESSTNKQHHLSLSVVSGEYWFPLFFAIRSFLLSFLLSFVYIYIYIFLYIFIYIFIYITFYI